MKLKFIGNFFLASAILFSSFSRNDLPMFKSTGFSIYPDRVEQGGFRAAALNPEQMISDYASPAAGTDPVIQSKFSINGRDNELAFGVNHQANIYPDGDVSSPGPVISSGSLYQADRAKAYRRELCIPGLQ